MMDVPKDMSAPRISIITAAVGHQARHTATAHPTTTYPNRGAQWEATVAGTKKPLSGRPQPLPPSHWCRRRRQQARLRLLAPSVAVTSHVLNHRFQLGQALLGQGETGPQLCRRLDRSREWVDTRRFRPLNFRRAVFLTAREDPARDYASEYRLAVFRQARC